MSYDTDEIIRIANNMIEYGGHFAGHIGRALLAADSLNRERLEQAFPEMLEKYAQFPSN